MIVLVDGLVNINGRDVKYVAIFPIHHAESDPPSLEDLSDS